MEKIFNNLKLIEKHLKSKPHKQDDFILNMTKRSKDVVWSKKNILKYVMVALKYERSSATERRELVLEDLMSVGISPLFVKFIYEEVMSHDE